MADNSAFPQLEGLLDLACRSGVDIRPTLLRVLTDLYMQARRHSAAEEAQYVELATRLIDSVDDDTRRAIATRLASYPHAPPAILRRLQNMVGPVDPLPAPPAETDLSEAFFTANSFERRLILTNLGAAAPQSPGRIANAAVETCQRLEAAILARNLPEFVRLLESALMLPPALADKIARDNFGEPILVAARALGMPAATLQRILLLINPAISQSVQRVYELAALYDDISSQAAEAMIAIWRGTVTKQRPAYQPALHDDRQASSREAATPSRYRSARRTESLSLRHEKLGR